MNKNAWILAATLAALPALAAAENLGSTATAPGGMRTLGGVQMNKMPAASVGGDCVVYFDLDKTNVRADQVATLDQCAKDHTGRKLAVKGYADPRGPAGHNMTLSQRRAAAVKQALVQRGFKAGDITVSAFGGAGPADAAQTEEAWQADRRVEISAK